MRSILAKMYNKAGVDPEFGKGGCTLLKRLKTKEKQGGGRKQQYRYHYEVKVHNYYSHL